MSKDTTAMQKLFLEFRTLADAMKQSGDDASANLIDFICERESVAIGNEREQILNAYNQGYRDAEVDHEPNDDVSDYDDAEQYYNQTYNN